MDDKDLQELIFSKEGKDWLINEKSRNFAIDFLRTQRQQSEDEDSKRLGTKLRVYELARELNLENQRLMDRMQEIGIEVKSHMSLLSPQEIIFIKENLYDPDDRRINPNVIRRRRKRVTPSEELPNKANSADAKSSAAD